MGGGGKKGGGGLFGAQGGEIDLSPMGNKGKGWASKRPASLQTKKSGGSCGGLKKRR